MSDNLQTTSEQLQSNITQTAGMIRSEVKRSYAHSGDHLDNSNSSYYILDMNWSGVNEDRYYRVTIRPTSTYTEKHMFIFQVERSRNSNYSYWGKPTYGSQDDPYGFDLMLNMTFITGSTGSWNDGNLYINEYNLQYSNGAVIGTVNTSYGSTYVEFYVRGGSKYLIRYSETCEVSTYVNDVLGVVTEPIIYTPTESSIEQTAERISMYVVATEGLSKDELKRTGIDITSGNVIINADQTTITGNLNLNDTENGMTIYDNYGRPCINLQPKTISDMALEDSENIITGSNINLYYSPNTPFWSGSSSPFSVTGNQTVLLDTVNLQLMSATMFPSSSSIYGRIRLFNSNFTQTIDVSFIRYQNGCYKLKSNPLFAINNQNGTSTYYLEVLIDSFSDNADSARQFNSTHVCTTNIIIGGLYMTYIGRDGVYSHTGANKLFKTDTNNILMQMGNAGLRLSNNTYNSGKIETICGISSNSINSVYRSSWIPLFNWKPLMRLGSGDPYNFTMQNFYYSYNERHTRYAWRMDPTRDYGDILLWSPPMDSNNDWAEGWIILPPEEWTDSDGYRHMLPEGYIVTIWNSYNQYNELCVTPYRNGYGSSSKIIDANHNDNDFIRLDDGQIQCNETFMYVGHINSGSVWLAMHDVQ